MAGRAGQGRSRVSDKLVFAWRTPERPGRIALENTDMGLALAAGGAERLQASTTGTLAGHRAAVCYDPDK